jgi:hypothetical protein
MNYLDEVRRAVEANCGCRAAHAGTVPVTEVFRGRTVWSGDVEVFDLTGHAKARRCYAWGYPRERGPREVLTVLEVPPVTSPETAVKVAVAAHAKRASHHGS